MDGECVEQELSISHQIISKNNNLKKLGSFDILILNLKFFKFYFSDFGVQNSNQSSNMSGMQWAE